MRTFGDDHEVISSRAVCLGLAPVTGCECRSIVAVSWFRKRIVSFTFIEWVPDMGVARSV